MHQPQMEETDLQKLLRLKRYETPGEEYFEDFLTEFQRRQRVEMAKAPLWRIALDRMSSAFSGLQVPRVAYGATFAVFLALVGVRVSLMDPTEAGTGGELVAAAVTVDPQSSDRAFGLMPSTSAFADSGFTQAVMQEGDPEMPTRYILDSRPVSYGTSLRF